jgi:ElaA protein
MIRQPASPHGGCPDSTEQMARITPEWRRFEQLSAAALYALLRFRQSIFVVEQRSPYADLDGLDFEAWHLRLVTEGELAGYLRVVPFVDAIRIGRVAVAPPLRRQGLGRMMMGEALAFCQAHYPGRTRALSAQLHLVRFYGSFGFSPVSTPYDDGGLMHIDMAMRPES